MMNDELENIVYEYRPMYRSRTPDTNGIYYDEDWSDWKIIYTYSGRGKPYSTIGGAKSVSSREKASHAKSKYNQDRNMQFEYKIQRRPVSIAWEDV